MNPLLDSVDKIINELTEEKKALEKENKTLKEQLDFHKFKVETSIDFIKNYIPKEIYYHKERKNTTIVFSDNTSITVHLKNGDKNCIETAIAWALMKHNYRVKELLKLVKKVGE